MKWEVLELVTNLLLIKHELLQTGCKAAAEFSSHDTASDTAAVQFIPKCYEITVANSNTFDTKHH